MGLFLSAFTAKKLTVSATEIVKHWYFLYKLYSYYISYMFLLYCKNFNRWTRKWKGLLTHQREDLGRDTKPQLSLILYYFLKDSHERKATKSWDKNDCKEEMLPAWEKEPPICLCSRAIHTPPESAECKSPVPAPFTIKVKANTSPFQDNGVHA